MESADHRLNAECKFIYENCSQCCNIYSKALSRGTMNGFLNNLVKLQTKWWWIINMGDGGFMTFCIALRPVWAPDDVVHAIFAKYLNMRAIQFIAIVFEPVCHSFPFNPFFTSPRLQSIFIIKNQSDFIYFEESNGNISRFRILTFHYGQLMQFWFHIEPLIWKLHSSRNVCCVKTEFIIFSDTYSVLTIKRCVD